ncbi:MAG: cysteine desulfurase [Fimbriiglobus sp.]|nr:cysteine desulfurase [Fimbriiglobus sp.]
MPPIYLDYNATTPVDPAVADAITAALRDLWGNPSSGHEYGRAASDAVATARQQLADLLGAMPSEIVFTGGGSEASNLALKGVCTNPAGLHVITSAVEHPATAKPVEWLKMHGTTVTVVPVDGTGRIDPDAVRTALRASQAGVRLVSLMHSNNEVGTFQPVREVGGLKSEFEFLFHTDAAQSLGKVTLNVNELNVDLLTVAGHKLYAPKGVGALFVRDGVKLQPLIHGAGHEAGRRAGTENTPYIVGLGVAASLCADALPAETERLKSLRDRLHSRLRQTLGDKLVLNGHLLFRLPNTLNVSFRGQLGPELLERVPRIAASVGSACHETKPGQARRFKPSPVLAAMGCSEEVCRGAVRLSVGRGTTEAEVDEAAELLTSAVASVN